MIRMIFRLFPVKPFKNRSHYREHQAKNQCPEKASHFKAIHNIIGKQNNNGIDGQQEKPQRNNSYGQGE